MGYGPVINGKQKPISSWHGSWAQQEFAKRCEKPRYSTSYKRWIVRHPDRSELIVASGTTAENLIWSQSKP